jgi:hypothetical protein
MHAAQVAVDLIKLSHDRVVRSLSMNDSDWAVRLVLEENDRREGVIMFVRRLGSDLKIVGMWD